MKRMIKKGERNYAIKITAFALGAVLICIAFILIGAFIAKIILQ